MKEVTKSLGSWQGQRLCFHQILITETYSYRNPSKIKGKSYTAGTRMEKEAKMFDSKSMVKICYEGSLSWSRNYYE